MNVMQTIGIITSIVFIWAHGCSENTKADNIPTELTAPRSNTSIRT